MLSDFAVLFLPPPSPPLKPVCLLNPGPLNFGGLVDMCYGKKDIMRCIYRLTTCITWKHSTVVCLLNSTDLLGESTLFVEPI